MRREFVRLLSALVAALAMAGCAGTSPTRDTAPMSASRPSLLVIAHRGASALRPEHTLEAYALAIELGADMIEPDLVMTRDGVLVARHENELSDTTDVAERPEFANRRSVREVDGKQVEGWFSEDFTLVELKTLHMRERIPQLRSTAFDDRLRIATLAEIIELAACESERRRRLIGLAPEIKHPSHFQRIGLAMEQPLLDALAAHPHTREAPVLIQSFETTNLRRLRDAVPRGGNIRLLQLTGAPDGVPHDLVGTPAPKTYADLLSDEGLRDVARYADAIGSHYQTLAVHASGSRWRSTVIEAAHAAGLDVFAYTFRPENHFIDPRFRDASADPAARNAAGSIAEIRAWLSAGIDGFFADDPGIARQTVDGFTPSR
ncbi:MAG: glycerophosphodiester phosphodiesterase family protein [Pseudoxanthomonas suwonensis]|nr:glycerophosphodiester phosphodiesterase family protein [Pseudoxanthomonas suwonensis]